MRIVPVSGLIASLLFTHGCATAPQIVEKPVYVNVPVTVPCVGSIPKEPFYETKTIRTDDDLDAAATAYLIEIEQRKIHIAELRGLMAGCVKP